MPGSARAVLAPAWSSAAARLPREGRDTLFLLIVIGWILLPQAQSLPLWCSLGAAGVLGWRGWLAWHARALPNRWWLMGLLAAALGATWFTHQTLLGRDAGVTLLVILLSLKTLELRARRDAFVVFFLGFFTMLTNFFYSQSLLTAVSMLLGLLGLLTALVNAHMPVGRPPLMEAAKTAGWMALLGAPIMIVLFMLFPRMAPLWGMPNDAMTGRSGLSATMEVGTIASLALDDSVAMRIRFDGTPPPRQTFYFRGPVLSSFDGRRWETLQPTLPQRYLLAADLRVRGEPIDYEVTLEPSSRPWLFVLESTPEAPQMFGNRSTMQPDLQWLTRRPITDLTRYRASSYTDFQHGPTSQVIGLQEYVDLPPGYNPRTLALANQIRRDPRFAQADTPALVSVVMERLRTGGYRYTLDPGVAGQHTADEFWFDTKEGFCEHIASAFVILMRALDVPARIVTGYQGGEVNNVDGFWVVRQSDAHAWAEVWQAGTGWVRVDPTSAVSPGRVGASQRLSAPRGVVGEALNTFSPTFAAQLRAGWEAVNNRWNQWVLNYTQTRQLDMLKNLGFKTPSWEDLGYVLIVIVVAASLLGAAWGLWDRRQHDPWLQLLARARRKLMEDQHALSSSTSPRQIAARLKEQHGGAAKAAHDWLIRLEAQRYGPAPAQGPKDRAALRELGRELHRMPWPPAADR